MIGFFLKIWLELKGINGIISFLLVYLEYMLFEERGIVNMFNDEFCNRFDFFYNGSLLINGWILGII